MIGTWIQILQNQVEGMHFMNRLQWSGKKELLQSIL